MKANAKGRKKLLRLFSYLLAGVAVIALAEFGLRAAASSGWLRIGEATDADPQENILANRLAPGAEHLGHPANSHGYYDTEWSPTKPERIFRILAFSDGFGVGSVPYPENFLTLLEESLNRRYEARRIEVLNLAVPNASPREYVHLLEQQWSALGGDLALATLFVGDDFDAVRPPTSPFDPRKWLITRAAGAAWSGLREPSRAETNGLDRRAAAALERAEKTILKQPERSARSLAETERAWKAAFVLLDEMNEATESRLLIITIPDEFQVRPEDLERILAFAGWSRESIDLERPQRTIRSHGKENMLPVCDLTTTFRAMERNGSRMFVHEPETGEINLSIAGNLTAEYVIEFCLTLARMLPPPDVPLSEIPPLLTPEGAGT